MATNKRVFTMRMQQENFDKIRVISALNKRSVAMQIEYLIERCIAGYESENGKIPLSDEDNSPKKVIQNNKNGDNNYYERNTGTINHTVGV